ncbi:MAG: hypothetical protein ABIH38_04620 [Patescibacteria group bacterium]
MDHSNSVQHSHCMCKHGMCLQHDPKWENLGDELVPSPAFFGIIKTYGPFNRCCGKAMARYKKMRKSRCQKCGRIKMEEIYPPVALCLCCGYHFDVIEDCGDD